MWINFHEFSSLDERSTFELNCEGGETWEWVVVFVKKSNQQARGTVVISTMVHKLASSDVGKQLDHHLLTGMSSMQDIPYHQKKIPYSIQILHSISRKQQRRQCSDMFSWFLCPNSRWGIITRQQKQQQLLLLCCSVATVGFVLAGYRIQYTIRGINYCLPPWSIFWIGPKGATCPVKAPCFACLYTET